MAPGHVVIVVGAGLAGLSAAVELKRHGFTVDLYERSRLLGGKATSFEIDGIEVDNGQHVILACCTEFIDFVQQLEIASQGTTHALPSEGTLVMQDRFDALLLKAGKRPARVRAVGLPAPLHLAVALMGYHHLSFAGRIRVALALVMARHASPLHESFDFWLTRNGQTAETRQAFWDPFFVPALNAQLDRVGAEDALFVIRTAFLQDARAARFGFSRIPLARIAEVAAASLDSVHLRSSVASLALGPGSHLRGVVLEDGAEVSADAVILAIPPARLQRLLGNPKEFGIGDLAGFHTAPIIDVHLWYDVPTIGFGFAAILDSPIQWVFEKAPGYLCCSLSAADAQVGVANADLVQLCHQELLSVLPQLQGINLIRGSTTRDREATFIPTPGLRRPGATTSVPRLAIAGAWTDTGWPATMESAVLSGRAAARAMITQFASAEAPISV